MLFKVLYKFQGNVFKKFLTYVLIILVCCQAQLLAQQQDQDGGWGGLADI